MVIVVRSGASIAGSMFQDRDSSVPQVSSPGGCAAETTGSRRCTATSGSKEIRQHVLHDFSEYWVIIIQRSAIGDRAAIEDAATVGPLPVNQLRYRIYIDRIEVIVIWVAA